ncbi:forkhead box protein N2 [Tetranychus urticae]|uniref:Fork-head domain-containing protein n=1 Tax=Tetranychus urticae TaxID=32264 RepID=T1KS21_TETUR|nr:forkhead box protein N2 [Tetranychus urticae]
MGLIDNNNKKSDSDLDDERGVSIEVGTVNSYNVDDNDDLTNLTWLQDRNLLKSMTVTSDVKDNIVHFIKEEDENVYPDDVCSSPDGSNKDETNLPCSVPPVPYNPKIHIHAKPPYSFSSLIFMAIESSPNKALPVKDIYAWIVEHFPYYQNSPSGWKNTVRHNLSLNKCFKKLDKGKDELPIVGKGSLWCVDPELRPNLLQAVRRTPAHIYPYMSTAKTNFKITSNNELSPKPNRSHNVSRKILTFDQIPQLADSPLLGKRLLIPIINRESEEADAAQSMLTLTRYNSEEGKSNKSEPHGKHQTDDSDSPSSMNPTGDHNYFSRSSESKKHNIELLTEAQKLVDSKVNLKTTSTTIEEELPKEEIDLIENVTIVTDDGKKTRGTVLVKRKVDVNDEDGLKGAQALLNLASRSLEVKAKDELKSKNQQSQQPQLPSSFVSSINSTNNSTPTSVNSIALIKRTRRGRE